jgi:hypothetical protein
MPGIGIYASQEMIDILELIELNGGEIKDEQVSPPQKKLLKQLLERNLVARRRKNNEVSYSVRSKINWK